MGWQTESTWNVYVGFRHYLQFCKQLHLPVWPAVERTLEKFVTALADINGLGHDTIKGLFVRSAGARENCGFWEVPC